MKVIVARSELLAALLFASQDESRFVINGVLIVVRPLFKPVLVTTDGRRLAVIETLAEQAQDFEAECTLLLRSSFVKPICALNKSFGGKLFPWISFEQIVVADKPRLQVKFIGGDSLFDVQNDWACIEGAYPDWRKVVPSANTPRQMMNDLGLNAEFVGDFAKAAKHLNSNLTPVIQMNLIAEDSGIEVKISGIPNFYGLVMPCRADKETDYQPEFLGIVEGFQEAEKAQQAAENEIAPGVEPTKKSECDEDEELIAQCIEVIHTEQKASVSLLQRRLRLGYTRATRIMDELEVRGVVGPSKGAEPREILIDLSALTVA